MELIEIIKSKITVTAETKDGITTVTYSMPEGIAQAVVNGNTLSQNIRQGEETEEEFKKRCETLAMYRILGNGAELAANYYLALAEIAKQNELENITNNL